MADNEDNPAKRAVIKEWDDWALNVARMSLATACFSFPICKESADLLLDFKYPGDKWQIVYSWLLRAGRVGR